MPFNVKRKMFQMFFFFKEAYLAHVNIVKLWNIVPIIKQFLVFVNIQLKSIQSRIFSYIISVFRSAAQRNIYIIS